MTDEGFMRGAIALARRGLGETAPNPSVGCVIVKAARVIGRGRTAPGGRPHAEIMALRMAGETARGATAYVTLEPCCFTGKSGPCTDALIKAGIARIVIGAPDPHPKVNGEGLNQLRAAGMQITQHINEAECLDLIAGFAMVVRNARPLFTLKLASTLDGRIATDTGASKWLTGAASRHAVHAMRGEHDAILTGIGTVLADDPELTCRIDGFRQTPLTRIVVDRQLRTPLTSKLVEGAAKYPLWILHGPDADPARHAALEQTGVVLLEIPTENTRLDLAFAVKALAARGLTRVMIEAGGKIAGSFLHAKLIDRLAWFHAPALIGADGLPATAAFGVSELHDMPRFSPIAHRALGADMLSIFRSSDGTCSQA